MSQQAVSADIIPNSAVWAPPARAPSRVQHMIQLYAATTVQTGFIYLCIQYCFIRHFFGQSMKEFYENIFNKPAV
jgi:hypothetical protein